MKAIVIVGWEVAGVVKAVGDLSQGRPGAQGPCYQARREPVELVPRGGVEPPTP